MHIKTDRELNIWSYLHNEKITNREETAPVDLALIREGFSLALQEAITSFADNNGEYLPIADEFPEIENAVDIDALLMCLIQTVYDEFGEYPLSAEDVAAYEQYEKEQDLYWLGQEEENE